VPGGRLRAVCAKVFGGEKGTQLFCRNGPKDASHKRAASPFSPPSRERLRFSEHVMRGGRAWRVLAFVPPVVLALCVLAQTRLFRQSKSITCDETLYVSCAVQTVHDGWLDPRLSQSGVGPLPIVLCCVPAAAMAGRAERPHEWKGLASDPPIVDRARLLNAALVGVPLVLTVYVWLLVRRGTWAATVGAGLVAFSPSLLAHFSLATTDAAFALFALLAIAVLAWRLRRPSRLRFLGLAAAIGVALSAKYSSVFLFPVAFLLLAAESFRGSSWGFWKRALAAVASAGWKTALLGVLAFFVLWGVHGFSFTGPLKTVSLEETPSSSPWIKLIGDGPRARWIMDVAHTRLKRPAPVAAAVSRYLHERDGHAAFLLGMRSERGWRYYFPCAWFFKSTPAELLLTLAIPVLLLFAWRWSPERPGQPDHSREAWVVSIGVFWVMVCCAHVNIGHRYLLVLYPLTILLALDLTWRLAAKRRGALVAVGSGLLAIQALGAVAIAPHYLAYFTPLVGGPEEGLHYLGDSNLDWGQDLPGLQPELDRLGYRRALVDYFGTADLSAYGLKAEPLSPRGADRLDDYDALALSVTSLQGIYFGGRDPFAPFRAMEPVGRSGYSILIYDLRDPSSKARLRAALRERFPQQP